jgi:hypothetical protein
VWLMHAAVSENCAYGKWSFMSEIFAFRRVSLSNSINCRGQIMFRAFRLMKVLINRLAVLLFQRKREL